jgi:hypothetical protein
MRMFFTFNMKRYIFRFTRSKKFNKKSIILNHKMNIKRFSCHFSNWIYNNWSNCHIWNKMSIHYIHMN